MQVMIRIRKLSLGGALLWLSLTLVAHCPWAVAVAQEPASVATLSGETYRRVVDLVFRRVPGDFKDQNKEFALTLRFKPAFDVESQINIVKYKDGNLDVVIYTLPKGSQSIREQLNAVLRQTKREDAEEMAKRINVRRQPISDTTKVRELLKRFAALRFTPQLDTSITLDGTGFQLWYEAVSTESYYSLVGGDPGQDRGDHRLVRWMNEVREAVLRQLASDSPPAIKRSPAHSWAFH